MPKEIIPINLPNDVLRYIANGPFHVAPQSWKRLRHASKKSLQTVPEQSLTAAQEYATSVMTTKVDALKRGRNARGRITREVNYYIPGDTTSRKLGSKLRINGSLRLSKKKINQPNLNLYKSVLNRHEIYPGTDPENVYNYWNDEPDDSLKLRYSMIPGAEATVVYRPDIKKFIVYTNNNRIKPRKNKTFYDATA